MSCEYLRTQLWHVDTNGMEASAYQHPSATRLRCQAAVGRLSAAGPGGRGIRDRDKAGLDGESPLPYRGIRRRLAIRMHREIGVHSVELRSPTWLLAAV